MKSLPLLTSLVLAAAAAQAQPPAAYETGAVLPASSFLPPELLRGDSFRVRDQVVTDGYMAHFEIDTDFGTFAATGVPQAKQRIAEAAAIRKLVETSKGDLFAEGMRRSIEQPIDAVKNIVRNPVDTVKEAPRTVGHFFGKVGSAIGRSVTRTVDRVQDSAADPETDAGETAGDIGRGIGGAAKGAAGFDKAKLDTARQLGVDPYSDNPRLQEEMEKVTWAFFAGGLPLRAAAAAASAGVAVAATQMVGIPEDTYALTPSEIALRDETSLNAMGVPYETIKDFQINRALSVTLRHRLVTCLETMPKAGGRESIILLANACTTPDQADFLANAVAILTERQQAGGVPYAALKTIGRLPGGITASGIVEVPAPVDHVTWTEEVAAFAQRDDLGQGAKLLVHTGRLSPAASAGLAAAGWQTQAVPYPKR